MSDSVRFQAVAAIRTAVQGVAGLWPVQWDNRVPQPPAEPATGTHYIVETYLGGKARDAAVGITPRWRIYTDLVAYVLSAPPDDGVKATQNMADAIERAVTGTVLYLADNATPVRILAADIAVPVNDGDWVRRRLAFTYAFTTT